MSLHQICLNDLLYSLSNRALLSVKYVAVTIVFYNIIDYFSRVKKITEQANLAYCYRPPDDCFFFAVCSRQLYD